MKNVDKKYTPPSVLPFPPSTLGTSCILLSTRWPRKGRRFAAICHVGPEVLPERERESVKNMYVIAFVVVVEGGGGGESVEQGEVLKYISSK